MRSRARMFYWSMLFPPHLILLQIAYNEFYETSSVAILHTGDGRNKAK